jgi:hypothetical protein
MGDIMDWFNDWIASDQGLFLFVQGLRLVCVIGAIFFSALGLMFVKRGLNKFHFKDVLAGTSYLVLTIVLLTVFVKSLFTLST